MIRDLAHRNRAFLDTSSYYALIDRHDANHSRAAAIAGRLADERRRLSTTFLIVVETHALVLTRLGRAYAARVLVEIDRSTVAVIRPDADDELRARHILAVYDDKDFTLADAVSFAIMDRLGISDVFTFDHHFTQYGKHILDTDRP